MEQKVKIKDFLFYAVILVLIFISGYCKKAVLTAPDNTTLVVTVNPPVIPLGGQAIVKVVGFKASGTPVPDGTVIFFSVDIGSIESRKETLNGEAEVMFRSNDNRSGVATITISSGNATVTPDTVTITIGASGLSSLSLTADPPVLPVGGGASSLRVTAFDENFNPLSNIPVTLSTNAGQLNSSGNVITTNANGVAEDLLNTTVTAVITARSGNIEASITVNVESNEGPTASFVYSPSGPKVGEKVNFNASGSTDADGSIVSYQWDFGDGRSDSGETTTHKYKEPGTYTVVLVVQDNSDNRANSSQTVNVTEGDSPTASFIYSPANPAENEIIYFNASESYDDDGTIVSYDWDFGDGTTGTGKTTTHQYESSETFTVLLKVTDDDGNIDTTTQTISIDDNENPSAIFTYSPSNPAVNQDIYFNASDSSDPDGSIIEYQWDLGDGTTDSGVTITHRYGDNGTYTVFLKVTDNSGNTDSATKTITVSDNQSPSASFVYSPTNPVMGEPVHFNASNSSDPDGTITSWQWDFGDGTSPDSGEIVDHTYSDAGTYTVVLVVSDDNGNKDSVSQTVTIIDGTPIASFTVSPNNPNAGDTVTFNASGSSDPNGRIESWSWDFDDGSPAGTTEIITHQYTAAGIYVVELTVTDNDGNIAKTSQTVTVN